MLNNGSRLWLGTRLLMGAMVMAGVDMPASPALADQAKRDWAATSGLCTRRAALPSCQSPNGGQQTMGAWHIFYTQIPTYLADEHPR